MPNRDDPYNELQGDDHDSSLSELYQKSQPETPYTDLDDSILAKAKSAVEAEPSKADETGKVIAFNGWRRWSAPLAAAACMLLGISVMMNVMLYQETQMPHLSAPAPQNDDTQSVAFELLDQPLLSEPHLQQDDPTASPAAAPARLQSPPLNTSVDLARTDQPTLDQQIFDQAIAEEIVLTRTELAAEQSTAHVNSLNELALPKPTSKSKPAARRKTLAKADDMNLRGLGSNDSILASFHLAVQSPEVKGKIERVISLLEANKLVAAETTLDELLNDYPQLRSHPDSQAE